MAGASLQGQRVRERRARANALVDQALLAVRGGDIDGALSSLSQAKQLHVPVRDLDYVRALVFLKKGRLGDARECLKEELRHWPEHHTAQELLATVLRTEEAHYQTELEACEDTAFHELVEQVRPYTMLPAPRLYTLYRLARKVCVLDIPGNVVECGVAGGGSTALLAAVVKRYSQRPRHVFACDSYEGMPAPSRHDTVAGTPADAIGWGEGTCAASEESLHEVCTRIGAADIVTPIRGYFEETFPALKDTLCAIALLHVDCDWYASTKAVFEHLYDQVVQHGVIQVDDYGYWAGVEQAVQEFQIERNVCLEIKDIGGAAWLVKPAR